MNQPNGVLGEAILRRELHYAAALDVITSAVEDDYPLALEAARQLREAVELVRCLRRLLPACSMGDVHKAFGAPGDFGYETPIGDALARLYGVRK